MRYKIGYKQRGQWRYVMIAGGLQAAMDMTEKLFLMGYAQVSIKLLESEVQDYGIQDNEKFWKNW